IAASSRNFFSSMVSACDLPAGALVAPAAFCVVCAAAGSAARKAARETAVRRCFIRPAPLCVRGLSRQTRRSARRSRRVAVARRGRAASGVGIAASLILLDAAAAFVGETPLARRSARFGRSARPRRRRRRAQERNEALDGIAAVLLLRAE